MLTPLSIGLNIRSAASSLDHAQVVQELRAEARYRRSCHSGQAVLPHRRGEPTLRLAQLRPPLLGDGVSAIEAFQRQHRAANVPAIGCGKRAPRQETAL